MKLLVIPPFPLGLLLRRPPTTTAATPHSAATRPSPV